MIELPQRFENDIQGKDTYLVPLVVINDSIYLSTSKITLDNQHYDPLIKSLGNIKESIDIFEKKFKVSSVSMDFFNYEYNNKKLIDRFFAGEIINASVDVYYKSQSAISLNDCIKVYTGYVKEITEGSDFVGLEIEDRTEQVLGKEVPNKYTATIDLPEKHRNKPIPIVYGAVDRCPLVYLDNDNDDYAGKHKLSSDEFDILNIDNLKVFTNDSYLTVPQESSLKNYNAVSGVQALENAMQNNQWEIYNNSFIVDKGLYSSQDIPPPEGDGQSELGYYNTGTLASYNLIEVLESYKPFFEGGYYNLTQENDNSVDHFYHNLLSYSDSEGNYQIGGTMPFYVVIKDFGSPESEIQHQMWSYIKTTRIRETYFYDYASRTMRGYNLYNFNTDAFCSSSDVLNEYNDKPVYAASWLDYDFHIKYGSNEQFSEVQRRSPIITFNFSNGSEPLENKPLVDFNLGGNFYVQQTVDSGEGFSTLYEEIEQSIVGVNDGSNSAYQPALTTKINDTKFSLGSDILHSYGYKDEGQSGYMVFFGFNDMTLWKNAILKDFNDYDLYAEVTGRVDNMSERYTSTSELLTLSQMQDNFQQPKQQFETSVILPTRPVRTTAKIPIKDKKTKTRGGGKGSGY